MSKTRCVLKSSDGRVLARWCESECGQDNSVGVFGLIPLWQREKSVNEVSVTVFNEFSVVREGFRCFGSSKGGCLRYGLGFSPVLCRFLLIPRVHSFWYSPCDLILSQGGPTFECVATNGTRRNHHSVYDCRKGRKLEKRKRAQPWNIPNFTPPFTSILPD